MLIAQISDMHFGVDGVGLRNVDTAINANKVIDAVNNLADKPDIVLFTGDISDDETPASYEYFLKAAKKLKSPWFTICGNHDDRYDLRVALDETKHPFIDGGFFQYVVDKYPLRLVFLDTRFDGMNGGKLCDERLDWLENALAEDQQKPTVIVMHHPPFLSGFPFFDKEPLIGVKRFETIINSNPQIKKILCGHYHRTMQTSFAGVETFVAPSTGAQALVNFTKKPILTMAKEPPGFAVHRFDGERIISYVVSLEF